MLHGFTSQLVSSLCIVACVEICIAFGLAMPLGCFSLLWDFFHHLVLELFFWFSAFLFLSFLLLGVFSWGGVRLHLWGSWFGFVLSLHLVSIFYLCFISWILNSSRGFFVSLVWFFQVVSSFDPFYGTQLGPLVDSNVLFEPSYELLDHESNPIYFSIAFASCII